MLGVQLALLTASLIAAVTGHGYMADPPNRASMWRFGFKTPANYDDNQFYCGGVQTQWTVFKGGCGPCGDALDVARPRPNENGGKFGLGVISRRYTVGQEITVKIQLSANHMGWFRFSLCPLNSSTQLEEESCFEKNVLKPVTGGSTEYKVPTTNTGPFSVRLQLPPGLVCPRCVLQWHYKAGNSWGTCPDGSGALGCGAQETFRSCADIAIEKKDGGTNKLSNSADVDSPTEPSAAQQTTAARPRKILKPKRGKKPQNCPTN